MDEIKESHRVTHNIAEFLLGGKCHTSVVSNETRQQYTYEIKLNKKWKDKKSAMYYISVAKGYMDFMYLGSIKIDKDGTIVFRGKKDSGYTADTPSIRALIWVLKRALAKKDLSQVSVYHFGKCGRCGRELTDEDSIQIGLGPVCRGMTDRIYSEKYNGLGDA